MKKILAILILSFMAIAPLLAKNMRLLAFIY